MRRRAAGAHTRTGRSSLKTASAPPDPSSGLGASRARSRTPEGRTLSAGENTQIQVRQVYERSFVDGERIFDEGDEGDVLYIVQSGQVQLSREGSQGRRVVAQLATGDFFGEMAVVLGERRTARADAVGPTRLLELDGETLEAMCLERPEIGIRIISRLSSRLIEAERRLASLGVDDLLRPLVRVLVRRARPDPDGQHGIRIDANLRALADEAGVSMLEAHRALHQLLDQKVVRLIGDHLVADTVDSLSSCLDTAA